MPTRRCKRHPVANVITNLGPPRRPPHPRQIFTHTNLDISVHLSSHTKHKRPRRPVNTFPPFFQPHKKKPGNHASHSSRNILRLVTQPVVQVRSTCCQKRTKECGCARPDADFTCYVRSELCFGGLLGTVTRVQHQEMCVGGGGGG